MTTRPRRIQLRRTKGWRMPAGAVKVDRSTPWGNPFRWTEFYFPGRNTPEDARAEAVRRFRAAVMGFTSNRAFCPPHARPDSHIGRIIRNAPTHLRGRDLACWCPPDAPCHADVLLELANASDRPET